MKVLIVVDVQNDFCPGGSLAVENGNKIIPMINELSNSYKFDKVIASQDWHDEDHISFADYYGVEPFTYNEVAGQVVWPTHCVKNTKGAELSPLLDQTNIQYIVRKGMDTDVESYSAFFDNQKKNKTGLCGIIQSSCEDIEPLNVEIYIVGIATDVCVLNTALDARILNWEGKVKVIEDACAGVTEEGSAEAFDKMREEGIEVIKFSEV